MQTQKLWAFWRHFLQSFMIPLPQHHKHQPHQLPSSGSPFEALSLLYCFLEFSVQPHHILITHDSPTTKLSCELAEADSALSQKDFIESRTRTAGAAITTRSALGMHPEMPLHEQETGQQNYFASSQQSQTID